MPGESVVSYIDRWLEMIYRCENPPPRNMWITLCLRSCHHDFQILAIREEFENFEELAMFMETVEDRVLFPLRNMTRRTHTTNVVSLIQDSYSESDSEEINSVFIDPPPTARYDPPLHPYFGLYPIFKGEGLTFLLLAKKPWKHDMIFHRAKDVSISSPSRNFVSEGRPSFKPYNHQSHNMIRNMGYNLKRPTGLGMTEGILVPYTGMTKKQKEEFDWNHRLEESRLGIRCAPY